MILLGAVVGAGIGLGVVLVILGATGEAVTLRPRRPQSRLDRASGDRALWQGAAVVVVTLLAWAATGWVVGALIAGVLVVLLPRQWARARVDAEIVGRTEGVATWTEMLRDTLSAAAGLEQAIITTSSNAPAAIRPEVGALGRRLDRGERLVPALRRLADELANPAADLVVAALVTAAQREARDLVPLLGSLARSTRAEAELRLRVHASRARLRTAVRVVVGSLGLFAGGLILFNPRYLEPYRSLTGQLVLLLVAAVMATGYVLMQRMARLQVPERFLTRVGRDSLLETGVRS